MDKFSLDDVRDSFGADIAAQIRALAAGARALSETPCLEWRPETAGRPEFTAVSRACHTIYGTSSLVEARSLYESARLLHIAGNLGEECLRAIDDQLKLVRGLAVVVRHGAEALDRMLALELDHRPEEAWAEALRLRGGLAEWDDARREMEERRDHAEAVEQAAQEAAEEAARRPVPEPSPTEEFDFEDQARGEARAPAEVARASQAAEPASEFSFDEAEAESKAAAPSDNGHEPQGSPAPWPPSLALGGTPFKPAPPAEPAAPSEFSFDDETPAAAAAAAPPVPSAPQAASEAPRAPAPAEYSFDNMAADLPAADEAASPREYAFDDGGEAPSGELRDIFQQEAREYVVALQGYLQALSRNAADTASAASLERIYHTLKGTAATVGLGEVSRRAASLQDTMEAALEKGQAIGPAFLAQLVENTNALLDAGGLPRIGLESDATTPETVAARSPELRRLFWDDAAGVIAQAEDAMAQLGRVSDPSGVIDTLRGLFHRLKGSAVVAAEFTLAEAAGRLQDLCESGSALVHPQELRRGMGELERLLSPDQTPLPRPSAPPRREMVSVELDPVVWEAFDIEVGELLESIDRHVFALETSQAPKNDIAALFRAYHTLKGSVNTVGLTALGRLLHRLEDLLEELQEAPILPPLSHLATLLLNVQDEVRRNLRHARRGFLEVDDARFESEIDLLRAGSRPTTTRGPDSSSSSASGISGRADSGLHARPSRRERAETGVFDRRFVRVSTERLDGLMNLTGELVVSRSRLARRVSALQTMHRELTLGRNRLVRAVDRFREQHEFSLSAGARRIPAASARRSEGAAAVATFGELELDRYGDINILARSLADIGHDISQVQGRMSDSLIAFSEDAAGFGAIVTGLQTEITQARMVPVEQLFMRLRLPVRDAGEREEKDVRVVTSGEDVALDKAIIDELYTPLLHLVRNAVAHGIEPADARRAAGKEAAGTITLSARQEAGQVVLEVQDDGAGLDSLRLHALAVERGLVPAGTSPDDPAIAEVIFLPGLSTRAGADAVSGRGVGCDVVRRDVEKLGGDVHVSSLRGMGTTFVITLPLTLAITRALILRHRGLAYAVPLNLAERILELQDAVVHDSAGMRRISVDGVYHTLRSLDALLGLPARGEGEAPPVAAVLLRVGQNRLALEVDRVLGQEEIVVKGLGDVLTGHPLFSGVTVSGDGELILIFDVLGLLQKERIVEGVADVTLTAAPRVDRARVLFIDDSLSVRKVAERFLVALGAEVTLAADGREGLEKLRLEGPFHVVFTDLEMPRLHGYELVREIRTDPSLRHLPVVVVTSRSGKKHRDQAAAVGASDYLTKPFAQDVLGAMIRKWAGREARA
jgi:chemosensory pili system protein ChpA (sensor histidine kinase/response regulator)